jgi:transposase InsO family protein
MESTHVNRHRSARIMRLNGWRAKAEKNSKNYKQQSQITRRPNLRQKNFTDSRPNEKWGS